jgi:hypothetical protein
MQETKITKESLDEALEKTVQAYGITEEVLRIPKEFIFTKAYKLIKSLNIELVNILKDEEKRLVLLAIAEEWNEESDVQREKLSHLIKILEVSESQNGMHGTYSERLKSLYEKEFTQEIVNCEPEVAVGNYIRGKYIENNINKVQSWQVQRYVTGWGKKSPLFDIRKKLGVDKNNERKVKIIVSSIGPEVMREIGSPQFVFYIRKDKHSSLNSAVKHVSIPVIVLSYGMKKIKNEKIIRGFLEHEYAHIQSGKAGEGFTLGAGGLLFEGINEAFTETLVTDPLNYKLQREVLEALYRNNDQLAFKELIFKAYMGDPEARKEFMVNIIQIYGLTGISFLSRMSFKTNLYHSSKVHSVTDSILISPKDIIAFLERENSPEI